MRELIDIIQDKNAQGIPVYVMPIGLPASGKSTFFKELQEHVDIEILSFDSITEEFQKAHNMTYDEAYNTVPLELKTERFEARRDALIAQSCNIYPDLTNLSGATRGEVMETIPQYYQIGLYFPLSKEESLERCKIRETQTGKHIPEEAVHRMADNINIPRAIEFDQLFEVNARKLTPIPLSQDEAQRYSQNNLHETKIHQPDTLSIESP